jgi:hypothetical protein
MLNKATHSLFSMRSGDSIYTRDLTNAAFSKSVRGASAKHYRVEQNDCRNRPRRHMEACGKPQEIVNRRIGQLNNARDLYQSSNHLLTDHRSARYGRKLLGVVLSVVLGEYDEV